MVTLLVDLNQSASQTLLGFVRQGGGGDELKQVTGIRLDFGLGRRTLSVNFLL